VGRYSTSCCHLVVWVEIFPTYSLHDNSPHCVKFPWDVGKLLLNLNLGDSLAFLKKISCLYLALAF
jgi:hypothetical protein